jgi:hypothetical protein
MKEDELFSHDVIRRHEELMNRLEKKLKFEYFPHDESITLDGEHFIKGTPAKILKIILQAVVKDGRREFEYREFKRDFEISLGQKNSNFEVRFYRLIEKMEEKCPDVRIIKSERGRFSIEAACPIGWVDHPV